MATMEILKMNHVTFQYPEMEEKVLDDISLSIMEGQFIVMCGASGSGKTTLLRLLKQEIAPHGKQQGEIMYAGKQIEEWEEVKLATEIGFVFQDPDNQIVMDEVFQEVIFGMENIGIPYLEMRKRLSELAHFFGVEDLLYKKTNTLSGGQKQLVNLLSVLLLRPKVLLLDEPTSQLDPVAAKELLQILERLNNEMGITIIIVEHRLEDLFAIADKVIMLENGEIKYQGNSREVIEQVYKQDDKAFIPYLPSVSRLYLTLTDNHTEYHIPLTVKETRTWINEKQSQQTEQVEAIDEGIRSGKDIFEIEKVYFQYEKNLDFVIKNCDLTVKQGEFFALVGGNGSGKSTLLQIIMGILKQQRGKVFYQDRLLKKYNITQLAAQFAYLPQHPLAFYVEDTIRKEMNAIIEKQQVVDGDKKIKEISGKLQITSLLERHPNDLSGGELQRATIACLLLHTPKVLFVDEPTKGLDPISKKQLADLLLGLQEEGLTIFMVTHDIEFAVQYIDYCAILFDGQIAAEGTPTALFKGNYFYTTTINRATMASNMKEVLTLEEALLQWG